MRSLQDEQEEVGEEGVGDRTETKGRQVHRKIPKLPAGKGCSVLFVVGPTPKVNGQKHLEKAQ